MCLDMEKLVRYLLLCAVLFLSVSHGFRLKQHSKRSKLLQMLQLKGKPNGSLFFTRDLDASVRGSIGESVSLECSASGSPPPTIHWLYKDRRVFRDAHNSVGDEEANFDTQNPSAMRLSTTVSRLYLDCLTPADAGEYTCVAQSPKKLIYSSTMLHVGSSTEQMPSACLMNTQEEPARINMWSKNRIEYQNEKIQLYCRAEGLPQPKVAWLDRNNQPISNGDKQYEILENGDLVIKKLNWMTNMGEYSCVAENSLGSDVAKAFVYPTF